MAYDEGLATLLRDLLGAEPGLTEKKMFGGLAVLLHGNMAVGVHGDALTAGSRTKTWAYPTPRSTHRRSSLPPK